jgi:hypothetical protein
LQVKIVDGVDSSGFIVAEGQLKFDEILSRYEEHIALAKKMSGDNSSIVTENDLTSHAAADKPFAMTIKLKCADAFGGLELSARLKMTADINGGDWVFFDRSPEYWKSKRPQHWTTYPITPIGTGIVRQKFKDLAVQYDKQQIIHPAVWGFCMRYKV